MKQIIKDLPAGKTWSILLSHLFVLSLLSLMGAVLWGIIALIQKWRGVEISDALHSPIFGLSLALIILVSLSFRTPVRPIEERLKALQQLAPAPVPRKLNLVNTRHRLRCLMHEAQVDSASASLSKKHMLGMAMTLLFELERCSARLRKLGLQAESEACIAVDSLKQMIRAQLIRPLERVMAGATNFWLRLTNDFWQNGPADSTILSVIQKSVLELKRIENEMRNIENRNGR